MDVFARLTINDMGKYFVIATLTVIPFSGVIKSLSGRSPALQHLTLSH
jgi:hypothetical protein